ncbi:MAG: hypothetical protein ACREEM_10020 [Blastocatellia bacterium]
MAAYKKTSKSNSIITFIVFVGAMALTTITIVWMLRRKRSLNNESELNLYQSFEQEIVTPGQVTPNRFKRFLKPYAFIVAGVLVAIMIAFLIIRRERQNPTSARYVDTGPKIEQVVFDVTQHKGQQVRWHGTLQKDVKAGETGIIFIGIKQGYMVSATVVAPQERDIPKDKEIVIEGIIDSHIPVQMEKGYFELVHLKDCKILPE